jgi:molybdopterin adenylyltransferase
MKIGRVTLSDRASSGVYEDRSGPEIESIITAQFADEIEWERRLIPDDLEQIVETLIELCDAGCLLIITTGGTGPSARDVTPEATRRVIEKEMPGFGEIMRIRSYAITPTAILSRATAGVRGKSFIVNLPGKPKAIGECLPLILPAIVECVDHIADFRPTLREGNRQNDCGSTTK